MSITEILKTLRNKSVRLWVEDGRLKFDAPKGALTDGLRSELKQRKTEIQEFIAEASSTQRQVVPPVTRASRDQDPPASFSQQRLWFLEQLSGGNAGYNLTASLRLVTIFPLRVDVLQRAIDELVRRHEILRTYFRTRDGEPVQVVRPPQPVPLPQVDLTDFPEADRLPRLRQLEQEQNRQPMNLETGPLWRMTLVRTAPHAYTLIVTMHHVLTDGWSFGLLVWEISSLYDACLLGIPAPTPENTVQYADYAVWQRRLLQGEYLERLLKYWKRQLADLPQLELPKDFARPATQTFRGARHAVALPRETADALKQLGEKHNCTIFMALLACFHVLLGRYSGQSDFALGSTVANRKRPELERVMGFFVNTIVLRLRLGGNPTFAEALDRVRETVLEAFAHEDLPFERLVEELRPKRELSHSPLFQVMFTLQAKGSVGAAESFPRLLIAPTEAEAESSIFDLSLIVEETESGLRAVFEYNVDLFAGETIARMARHFVTLVDSVVATPTARVGDLAITTEAEQQVVLRDFNATRQPLRPACLPELFEEQARATPDGVAVVCGDSRVTFRELNRRANQLAAVLRRHGVGPDCVAGLLLDRSVDMMVAIWGVLKAGGAYMPVSPDYPEERIRYMLEDSGARVLLTHAGHGTRAGFKGPVVDVAAAEHYQGEAEDGKCPAAPGNLAYVIYTSGSTGNPKGAMLEHAGVVNRLTWMARHYGIGSADVILQKTTYTFDVSVWELMLGPIVGAVTCLLRPGGERDPAQIKDAIDRHGVTTVHFVPSMLGAFLYSLADGTRFDRLKRCICSGEALTVDQKNLFFTKTDGRVELHNLYGPTEASVDVTYYPVRSADTMIPIGKPVANTSLYVLDQDLRPVPVGVPGELCIGGIQVGRGYVNRPELTAQKFLPDPFQSGGRMYRTGDLARWLRDGNIEYLGRLDDQVKIRGYRIELGEIEAALLKHPHVKEAVVVARAVEGAGDKSLCAYVVEREKVPVDDLRTHLRGKLPDYMVPAFFVKLAELPISANGKVARKWLPDPKPALMQKTYAAPRDDAEAALADVFAQVLGVSRVGLDDNFFDLGGHSLKAVQVVKGVEARQYRMELADLFRYPAIRQLAPMLKRRT